MNYARDRQRRLIYNDGADQQYGGPRYQFGDEQSFIARNAAACDFDGYELDF